MKAIILAAGEGKRMKSAVPKVLHKVCGKPILYYVIDVCKTIGVDKIIVVVGHKSECVKESVLSYAPEVEFVFQEQQLGTGHAVMSAKKFMSDDNEDILVLCADTPLVQSDTLGKFIQMHKARQNAVSLISTVVDNPKGYGRIVRNGERFVRIVEDKDADKNQMLIKEINTGVYVFNSNLLKTSLQLLSNDNAQGEYYLTDTIEIIKSISDSIDVFCADDPDEFLGINDKIQLAYANKIMQRRINDMHMKNGVIMQQPDLVFISGEVQIAQDTIICPNVYLEGKTVIGKNCVIGPDTRIVDSCISDQVQIQYSVVLESQIKDNTKVGPFAYIRPNSFIDSKVKIGDFVEVKNSNISSGTKISHLTYVGDSDVGENVNFGCGTVTVNYDGQNKFRTKIQDNVFIGCNTNLVAPVTVEKNSYIAAGSTITDDVPEKSLAIARQRQINKLNWQKKS